MVHVIRKAGADLVDGLPESLRHYAIRADQICLLEPRPPGFPLLFTQEMVLIEEATAYLHFHAVQRGRTADTLRTYSEILYDWLETMEQNGVDWRLASASHLVAYRNRMLDSPSPHTKRRYRVSTINHRVRGVLRFYRWLSQNRLLDTPLARRADNVFKSETNAPTRRRRASQGDDFTLRQYSQLPDPLSKPELKELLSHLKPPYDLMARWQVYTGLRVSELLALELSALDNAPGTSQVASIHILRKGRKEGTILAPLTLLDETRLFSETYRQAWLTRGIRVGATTAHTMLFVGRRGAPVKKNTYQGAIKSAASRCGILATTHVLRATFACIMLRRLEELAATGIAINPLLVVKVLMGHEHIETTDRYLRAITTDRETIEDALGSLIKGLI